MKIAKCLKYLRLPKAFECKYRVGVKAALRVRWLACSGDGNISMKTIGRNYLPKWIGMAPAALRGRVHILCSLNGEDFWNRIVFTALWTEVFHLQLKPLSSLFSSATQTTACWDSEGLSWDQLVLPNCRQIPPNLTHSRGRLKSLGASFPVFLPLLGGWGRVKFSHWEQQGHLRASQH